MFILYFVLITDCLTKCPLDLELKISPDQVKVELDFFFLNQLWSQTEELKSKLSHLFLMTIEKMF